MDYLSERLIKLDKQIETEERALVHLNKQVGAKISKIKNLKEEREKVAEEFKER